MKTIADLIRVNQDGIVKEDYTSIVQTLYSEYRKIYGYDIDLDPRTADGRFIYDVATIIDTALLAVTRMYSCLDPQNATGHYLDVLCSLTNVQRREATHSYASVKFTNSTDADVVLTAQNSVMIDDSQQHEWYLIDKTSEYTLTPYLNGVRTVTVPAGETETFMYQCEDTGPIATSSLNFLVVEADTSSLTHTVEALSLGEDTETDSDLRARRAEDSNYGITILQGLQGSLRSLLGVKDARVYSYAGNSGEDSSFWLDNEKYSMPEHSVAVLLQEDSVNVPDSSEIAEMIQNMIPPGISTYQKTGSKQKSYSFYTEGIGTLSTVYWSTCTGVSPDITVFLNAYSSYAGKTTAQSIADNLISWLTGLSINYKYTSSQILSSVQNADPLYMSSSTYSVISVAGLGENISSDENRVNKGSFFSYPKYAIEKIADDWSSFTIKRS